MSNTPVSLALGRFKRLAVRSNDAWQGGLFRLPAWVEREDGSLVRPWCGLWVSERTGLMHFEPEPALDVHGPELVLAALLEFGLRHDRELGGRAATLKVTDPEMAASLRAALEGLEMRVEVVDEVQAARAVLQAIAAELDADPRPGILDAPGMTVEHLRSFADAAAQFWKAAPWERLQNEDLIRVHAPKVPRALSYFSVMGHAGQQFGLGFFETRADFDTLTFGDGDVEDRFPSEVWGCYFDEIDGMPIGDADAWEAHHLPLADPKAHPWVARVQLEGAMRRPTVKELAVVETLLRAIVATSDDQLDEGRWSVTVEAGDGKRTVELSLPLLLEGEQALRRPRFGPPADMRALERGTARVGQFLREREFASLEEANAALQEAMASGQFDGNAIVDRETLSPLERAQELVYDAFEATGRLRTKLARRALAVSPDCADAWTLLAEASCRPEHARDCYQQAVEAGERALGPQAFQDLQGAFWGHPETRPYMRARLGLAQTLDALGDVDGALSHFRALLTLNPADNQGVRYVLLATLLRLHRDDEAGALLKNPAYADDSGAEWLYAAALWTFRREGVTPRSRRALSDAIDANPFVVSMLTDNEDPTVTWSDHFAIGSPEEAAVAVELLREAWDSTPGALQWLRASSPRPRSGRHGSRRRPSRRRR